MKLFKIFLFFLFLANFPQKALAELTWNIPENVKQGSGFVLSFKDNKPFKGTVFWQKKEIPFQAKNVDNQGFQAEILLGMPIDATNTKNFQEIYFFIDEKNIVPEMKKADVKIVPVKWDTQKLTVEPKYVTPPKETLNRIEKERKIRAPIMAHIDPEQKWKLPLHRPVKGIVTSPYGSRRVFNNVPKSPHMGVDFRGATGNSIQSVADGKVVLVADHYYAGNCVIVDHGQGVLSYYAHLSAFSVKEGEIVKKGQEVGKVGATGRVTASHLHLSLYIQGVAVDFMTLTAQ